MPAVSIGVPVFNGEKTLTQMLDSLLSQTFADFEIIISDNASTDKTADIAKDYARRDPRIRYMPQAENIGPERNFKYVLDEACGRFFMWSASDDIRSPDFLHENVFFLEQHPDYVASTSPNCFEGQSAAELVRFELSGSEDERIKDFFRYCWVSHGIFYSVIRTDVLRACEVVGQPFLGTDWAIDLYLASKGKMHRTQNGLMVSGAHGISNSANAWKRYRTSPVGWLLPFHKVSLYTLKLTSHQPLKARLQYLKILFNLNMRAAYSQFHAEFYPAYRRTIRPWINKLRGKASCNS
jgi:glycosyltransferase involved in cell wall biosynthesis